MTSPLTGIHHVTAIASDPQANVDFYGGLLGLRLVKKTVNFDDPSAYHLYYGDEIGAPGSIVTFFYWPGGAGRGRVGFGQTTRLSFSAAPEALAFWEERLRRHNVGTTHARRFGEDVLTFIDPDGIPLEIVAVASDARRGWIGGPVPAAHALRGMHTAELTVRQGAPTEKLVIEEMGYRVVRRDGSRARFENGSGGSGTYLDIIEAAEAAPGIGGVGTIHHIAWRVPDDAAQNLMQDRLANAGYHVSPVRDRNYFHSIYYREPGGILFEIATDSPGFAIDEPVGSLGSTLKLPSPFEHARARIESLLPPLAPPRSFS